MAITLLIPTLMPERCYLIEALMWVALNRFPLGVIIPPDNEDVREDLVLGHVMGAEPFLPKDPTVTDEECAWVGLPPNPMYRALKEGKEYHDPDGLRAHMDRYINKDHPLRSKWEKVLEESVPFHEEKLAWESRFEELLNGHKARLLIELQSGRIKAFGLLVDPKQIQAWSEYLRGVRWPTKQIENSTIEDKPSWTRIPSEFWIPEGIRWEGCWGVLRNTAYCLILVETTGLLDAFPPPAAQPFFGAARIATTLVLKETVDYGQPLRRRGKPAYDWARIFAEVERKQRTDGLPPKLEALVAEMMEWCIVEFGFSPARSTLAARLSRYYY
jgi:hypothetical protein